MYHYMLLPLLASAGAGSHYCTISTFRSRSHSSSEARGSIIELQQQNATSKYRKLMLESSAHQMLFLYLGLVDSAGLVRLKTVGIIGLCNFASVGSQTRQQELLKPLYNGIWRGDIARQDGLHRYGCRVMAIYHVWWGRDWA